MRHHHTSLLLPIERVALAYCLLTLLLMACFGSKLEHSGAMLLMRAEWAVLTMTAAALGQICSRKAHEAVATLRIIVQLAWLSQWYPDTYEFNRSLPSLDHLAARAEQWLFGCQPSLLMHRWLDGWAWSEAFNMGYFSYFPMIATLVACMLACRRLRPQAMHVATTLIAAFFIYYLIYIVLHVAGPQYYFCAIGIEAAQAGCFADIGTYFNTHTQMLPLPGDADGLFHHLVEMAHQAGERPTAAFPSSHVGISTIVMLFARRHMPRLALLMLPLWLLLCGATVYIQAHYLIDSIAGLISAPAVMWAAEKAATSPLTLNQTT